jgi:hypothetical protein
VIVTRRRAARCGRAGRGSASGLRPDRPRPLSPSLAERPLPQGRPARAAGRDDASQPARQADQGGGLQPLRRLQPGPDDRHARARARPATVRRGAGERPGQSLRQAGADRGDRREERPAPADLGRARLAGDRSPAADAARSSRRQLARGPALHRGPPQPQGPARAEAPAHGLLQAPSRRDRPGPTRGALRGHLPPPCKGRHRAPQPVPGLGLHGRRPPGPVPASPPYPQPRLRRARRPRPRRHAGPRRAAPVHRRELHSDHTRRESRRGQVHRALLPQPAALPAGLALQAGPQAADRAHRRQRSGRALHLPGTERRPGRAPADLRPRAPGGRRGGAAAGAARGRPELRRVRDRLVGNVRGGHPERPRAVA